MSGISLSFRVKTMASQRPSKPVKSISETESVALSSSTVAENQPPGTTVGSLGTADPNPGDTFSYALVSGAGSEDNGFFTLDGSTLLTAALFDYEAMSSFSIRVRTTDQVGLWYEEAFTITILDQQAQPLTNLAVELHQSNIDRGWDGAFNKWIGNSFESMKLLQPERFNKTELEVSYGDEIR